MDPEIYRWIVLPVLIFLARVCDVTIGTIKIIYIAKGQKYLAPLLAFFEISIWLLAIGEIMKNLDNFIYYFAYAGGFTLGNFVGIYIEGKLAIGTLAIRIITAKKAGELINFLRSVGYGVTSVDAYGTTGKVSVIYTVVKRKDLSEVIGIINRFNPKSFISIEEVRKAKGVFPKKTTIYRKNHIKMFNKFKKGK